MKNTLVAVLAFAAYGPLAAAQPAPPDTNPADPAVSVPAAPYESAFKSYRGFQETPLAPWRDANDEAARVGGHLGIVRGQTSGHDHGMPNGNMKPGSTARNPASK